jgi:glycosidase
MPRVLLAGPAFAALVAVAAAAPPEVQKVEPPSWWPGHSINPVRLLIRGRNLERARVTAAGAGLAIGRVREGGTGTYLFVDVTIAKTARPGPRRLKIVTADGSSEAPFEIATPLSRQGRFQGFSPDDVLYLIMPDRFANGDPGNDDPAPSRGLHDRGKKRFYHGGDLQGIIDRLAYLKELGVSALWLTPIYDNVNARNLREVYDAEGTTDYHGYGAVDFYGVEEHLGDLARLRELVDAAHRLGIKVIQDQVVNHTGPFHPWVKDPPTPTWFNGSEAAHLKNVWQTWTVVDPHATPELSKATIEGWFIDILPDLNQADPEVARYLIQNTLWWLGSVGFDGIRQDTLPYVPRGFWRKWMAAIKREYPGFRVLGEMANGDPVLVSFFQGGVARADGIDSGIDSLYDFPLYYPLRRAFAQGKPLQEAAVMLAHDGLYRDPSVLVTFLGLHDEPRFMNETGATIEGLKLAFTFLMTARGIPLLYYGDEIAMTGAGDPDNRRDFPGGWREDPRNAFEKAGRTAEQDAVVEHVRRLARLRAQIAALRRGAMKNLAVGEQSWAFARVSKEGSAIVVLNNAAEEATIECAAGPVGLADGALLHDRLGGTPDVKVEGGRLRVRLKGRSAAIYTIARD